MIVVGAIPLFKLNDIREAFPENDPEIVPILVLILGSVIFTISFFGCCGAIKESQCMVSTVSFLSLVKFTSIPNISFQYAFFLLVLVVAQIVLAVFAFMYTEDLADAARKGFDTLWNGKERNDESSIQAINGIQKGLQCCGKN